MGLVRWYSRNESTPVLEKQPAYGASGMTRKATTPRQTKKRAKISHPGMMGDGTEEQNLGERGNPAARIKKTEVATAFSKRRHKK
jgi:hypothetical protein